MNAPILKTGVARLGIDNAFARMPFRFGVVTIEAAASLTLALDMTVNGTPVTGYSSDLLAYKWFDKRPEKTPADNVADLLWVVEQALEVAQGLDAGPLFDLWRQLDAEVDRRAVEGGFNRLGAGFGVSMVERAMIDGLGRALGQGFHQMVQGDAFGMRPGDVFGELQGLSSGDAVLAAPLKQVHLRHTVGLVDPIGAGDLAGLDLPDDGLPHTLEDYLHRDGVRYLKIKVSGERDADLDRLGKIAHSLARLGEPVQITLDGNEQYRDLADFAALIGDLRQSPALRPLYDSILFIEQPLERGVALAGPLDPAALELIGKPMLIDESDGWTGAFHEAIALGYRGVSHKNCKGVIHSLLNALLVRRHEGCFQSAEDLTCLPVVSLQADLAVVAALGISHVERNGHHYFRGLDHLPGDEAEAALAAHPDLYERSGGGIRLANGGGVLNLGSLQVPGMGFVPLPDLSRRIAPADWAFDMLRAPSKTGEPK
ncbi:mandelate racemase [Oceaniglobus trochenteri]|uniref:mandelate racemase n=1 Tax=Oceaniglobus trochenteri TaxID=2763260 RepID=UPI001CFFD4B9|nr:mandelate racemase [Oceaniglobus trochenteri]